MSRFSILSFIFFLSLCNFSSSFTFLTNLKDAVNAVTDIVDGIAYGLKIFNKGLKTVEDVVDSSVENECQFSCPGGKKPKQNPYYKSYPQGCGAYGVQLKPYELPVKEMAECCNTHDICYGTCLADKMKCDSKFEKCLYKMCDIHKKHQGKDWLKNCKAMAKVFYLSTHALGCKAYKDAQAEACICKW